MQKKKKKIHVVTRDNRSRLKKQNNLTCCFLTELYTQLLNKQYFKNILQKSQSNFLCSLLYLFIYMSVFFFFHRKHVEQNMTVSKCWHSGQIPLFLCIGFIIKHSAFLDTQHTCNLLLRQNISTCRKYFLCECPVNCFVSTYQHSKAQKKVLQPISIKEYLIAWSPLGIDAL